LCRLGLIDSAAHFTEGPMAISGRTAEK
jgi:hypothetical protein